MTKALTHLDRQGRPRMVDVGAKPVSRRLARAEGRIRLRPETLRLIRSGAVAKGSVLGTAELAGVLAAKATASLIPLCHQLQPGRIGVEAGLLPDGVRVESSVSCTGRTGAEMEALTAVSVALLTVWDMCKAVDPDMEISGVRLLEKRRTPCRA